VADPTREITVVPQVMLLEQVLADIAEGRLRVPRFQRPFVWRPDQMRDLFDSIERGYPIGSLLVWQPDEAIPSLDQIAGIAIPAPPGRGTVSYLLDGHQRMSTLFGSLWRRPQRIDGADPLEWKWRIYRVLGRTEPERDRFQHWRRAGDSTNPPATYLPMGAVLRTMDFLAFSRRLADEVLDHEKLLEEAEELAFRIKSYQVALVYLRGGDLTHAVDAFSRLNTTGQTMTPDQMVSALTYHPGGETLAERIETIREALAATGFGQISSIIVFRTILAVAGEEDVQATRWEALAKRLRGTLVAKVEGAEFALSRAVSFLQDRVRVPLARLVPYQLQIMLLATFFHHVDRSDTADQSRELERWFWGTSWSGHFAGANSTDIKIAIQDMKAFARGNVETPWEPQRARPFPVRFDLRSARVRAFVLWELREFPKRRNASDDGWIDPVLKFMSSETGAYRHVVDRNVRDISHPANRLILPTESGVSVRRALLASPDRGRDTVLASHGIPPAAFDCLRENDGEGFILERARMLVARERSFMENMGIEPAATDSGDVDVDTE
jgi:hypothetical protein